jgi:hypothetical protein
MQALDPERDAVVATYREHGHALARGVPMGPLMAEMYGKVEGCSRGRGGSMHLFDAPRASTAATPSSAAACRWPSASPWPTRMRGRGHRLLLRRGGGRRRRVPRVHEPRRAVGLPVLFVCENNLYAMGVPLEVSEARPMARKAAAATHARRGGRRDGRDRRSRRRRGAAVAIRAGNGPVFPRMPRPTASAPIRCSTRALPDPEESRPVEGARPDRRACAAGCGLARPITEGRSRSRRRSPPRSTRPSPSPRPGPGSRSRT